MILNIDAEPTGPVVTNSMENDDINNRENVSLDLVEHFTIDKK